MRWRIGFALVLMTAAVPALAQTAIQRPDTTTPADDSSAGGSDTVWNLVGLLGLIGLIGLLPQHEDDSYHPADID